ncbi:MAG: hypothetical protein OXT70_00480 [Chloroflexota bacterium]|nr:hypothetical protein [Chloroflexota bacterium]MXX47915.1 hypothetical protein [Chloroflexota bacterium]MXY86132.1 hypothetical protein [Chloroflexota bacterium]
MSEDDIFRFLTSVAALVYAGGVASLALALTRAWQTDDAVERDVLVRSADRAHTRMLLPGIIATGVLGAIWGIRADGVDPIGTGWLLAVEILYLISLFVLVPGMFAGVRRVRLLSLQARKTGEISEELTDALNDRGPLVFAVLMVILLPVQVALVTLQP